MRGSRLPRGRALQPGEVRANRLTAFDILADGSLSNRRLWADLDGAYPDGICLDAESAVWYSDVPARRCVRVRQGGEVLNTVDLDRGCFACALGGPEKRTLFMTTATRQLLTRATRAAVQPGHQPSAA